MTRFTDGPAAGVVLQLRRAPLFLRATCKPRRCGRPEWDALDQLDDTPGPGERLHAYRKVSDDGTVHIDGRDKRGRRFGAWYACATYAAVEPQPDDATMRDNRRWREWATAEAAKAAAPKPADDPATPTSSARRWPRG